jgi:DNA-binding NtrC family response regulator
MATNLPRDARNGDVSKPSESSLPARPPATNALARGDWLPGQHSARDYAPRPAEDDPCRGTVLIVDDEPHVRDFVNWTLKQAHYGTIEAGSAPEAKQILQAYADPIALVICDIRMPGGNGLDFGSDLQKMRPGTPILYISGLVDSIVVESLARRDPRIVMTKPFTGPQLLARVGEFLDSPQQTRLRPAVSTKARRIQKL